MFLSGVGIAEDDGKWPPINDITARLRSHVCSDCASIIRVELGACCRASGCHQMRIPKIPGNGAGGLRGQRKQEDVPKGLCRGGEEKGGGGVVYTLVRVGGSRWSRIELAKFCDFVRLLLITVGLLTEIICIPRPVHRPSHKSR